ncbi:patatin-like phospholipase family protein [Salinisphaera sp.]|uniref:patatin-like phospholipase family protein n=1 Tax=Salinisphaera sp. TaxID=1914330 RepID=UPI002D77E42A|nr:patatin-like phospholipase family protein [Salinisphaera sp.]HET7312803.1 patatin-like phospholipase family protein [Salinisphaera sp.]
MTAHKLSENQDFVLVLQGGGALGAYQAGVYQALDEAGVCPDWIIGTSIGAINGALITGNAPDNRVSRLREFWHAISCDDFETWLPSALRHSQFISHMNALRVQLWGDPSFFLPRWTLGFKALMGLKPETASFYDTRPLRRTLNQYIDFDQLNAGDIHLSVGAASVTRGEIAYFETIRERLRVEHVLASCSLPPGFAATRVDGDIYWDGGVCSNMPLEKLLSDDASRNRDSLCFMVQLWNQEGSEPSSLMDVSARQKEIGYASRYRHEIEAFQNTHRLRHAISELFEALPENKRASDRFKALSELGSNRRMDIVRLGRKTHEWELSTKDINFSWATVRERWEHGYQDGHKALRQAPWQREDHAREGVFTHEIRSAEEDY